MYYTSTSLILCVPVLRQKSFSTISTSKSVQCLIKCLVVEPCKSININIKRKSCELIGVSLFDEDKDTILSNEIGWIHYDYLKKVCANVNFLFSYPRSIHTMYVKHTL